MWMSHASTMEEDPLDKIQEPNMYDPLHGTFWDDNDEVEQRNATKIFNLRRRLGRKLTKEDYEDENLEDFVNEAKQDRTRVGTLRGLIFDVFNK
mmetsp:Transcript_22749/g.31080  ORF Transcript_22749/g.31080 Transcript_22749/m.31080 type:complete len:94 (-) Transcript_22749:667-948(-)